MTDPTTVTAAQTWSVDTPTTTTTPTTTATPTASPTPSATTTPTTATTPTTPAAPATAALGGSWQVDPDKVTDFANTVAQVRSDLDTVFNQVNQLTSPSYQPQLGSSPCGQALTAKFLDRLSGSGGLLSNMNAVLTQLDQFVTNAQQSAAQYQDADTSTASNLSTT